MMKILLDTNAYTKLLSGNETILNLIAKSDIVYMSIFVLAELYTGFKGGKKELENRNILTSFLQKRTVKILPATNETAERFALIKNQLIRKGTPIPINDLWIAASAMESGAVLVTFDEHFKKIDGLRVFDNFNG